MNKSVPIWRGFMGVNQSLNSAAEVSMGTITEDYTLEGEWPHKYNSAIRVIPRDGYYRIHGQIRMSPHGSGVRQITVRRNVTSTDVTTGELLATGIATPHSGWDTTVTVETVAPFRAGDTVTCGVIQSSGSTLTRVAGAANSYIEATYVRPLGGDQAAVWTIFGGPFAVAANGYTYITFHADQRIWVGRYDGQSWQTHQLHGPTYSDDHNVAAIAVRPDGRLLVVYSDHTSPMWARVSTYPHDISSWTAESEIDPGPSSYATLHHIDDEDTWYLLYRHREQLEHKPIAIRFSGDGGVTWSSETILVDTGPIPQTEPGVPAVTGNAYFQAGCDGSRLEVAFNADHPRWPPEQNSLYHIYYQDGAWRDSTGTDLGSPPFAAADASLVWDGATANSWVWDIAPGPDGPRIVFAAFPAQQDGRYRYAAWDGSSWDSWEITTAGGSIGVPPTQAGVEHYSGGICLDHGQPSTVYVSEEAGAGEWAIRRLIVGDEGTVLHHEVVTECGKNMRPQVVRGDTRVIWFAGDYSYYTSFDTSLRAVPPLALDC